MKMNWTHVLCLSSALTLAGLGQAQTPSPTHDDALYQSLGAKAGIRKFTHRFLTIVLADPRIQSKFEDADIERLEGLLAEQFCDLSGGPCRYSGKDMKSAHRDKGINTAQFNALAEDLQVAMEEAGVSSAASNQLVAKLAPMYKDVVTK